MKINIVSSIVIFLISIFLLTINTKAGDKKYTGAKICGACHKGERNNNIYEKWQNSLHSKAYETLKSDKAMEIAKKKGIDDPLKSEECLSCHVTNGGKGVGIKLEDGVSCEACHGAGWDYKSMKVMKDKELAIKNGLILGKDDPELCKKCHNPKSPTYKKFDYEVEWKKIAHPLK